MRLSLSFSTGSDDSPAAPVVQGAAAPTPATSSPVALKEALEEIKKAWADANDFNQDESVLAQRRAWVGGAVRVYSLLSNSDPQALMASLPKPELPSRYAGFKVAPTPTPTSRPPRHPGAQRVVPQEELDAEQAAEAQVDEGAEAVSEREDGVSVALS